MKRTLYRVIKQSYNWLISALSLQELEDEVIKVPACDQSERVSSEYQTVEFSTDKDENGSCPSDTISARGSISINKYDLRREIDVQDMFHGVNKNLVDKIFEAGDVRNVPAGTKFSKQGDPGDDVFLILSGEVSIFINDQFVDTSYRHECVGEMVLFDATRRRSATLVAKTECVLFVVKSQVIQNMITAEATHAALIYNIAQMISERLRKRERLFREPNDSPLIFIGSSLESKDLAQKIEKKLKRVPKIQTELWTAEDMFRLSKTVMEDLERWISKCDFAILVLSKDDFLKSRGMDYDSPRDNVIFELGYCMGKIGRERTLFLFQDAKMPHPTKLPSDVNGLTYLPYTDGNKKEVLTAVGKILSTINSLGVRK